MNSLKYYNEALHLYEDLKDKNGVARNLGNIGFVYQQQLIFDKALSYNYRALLMNDSLGNRILKGMNMGNIGAAYLGIFSDSSQNKFYHYPDSLKKETAALKAEEYLNKSIAIFKEINDLNSLQELYGYLSDLQFATGNFKSSLASYKQHVTYRNTLYNESNEREIAQLEKNREEDLKQKEIALLKSQNEVERLRSQRSRVMNYGLSGAFIFLLIAAIGFFKQSKKRQQMNMELQSAYSDLKNAQDQLVMSEKMAAFGTLASRVAHEIQNPLNFVNNFSELSDELIKELNPVNLPNEQKETLSLLSENIQKILHHGKRADQIVKQLQQHINEGTAHEFFEEE
ncbi:MAG TPA: histidine kinase dimerization/phospho-acceptor domain-containing protein [Bacteroidia bacterium]|nr:histidine kinase dimerization/phospho-acceptor domain-containing protein [Bacteroidia bacterium]